MFDATVSLDEEVLGLFNRLFAYALTMRLEEGVKSITPFKSTGWKLQ
jgi:hypothetical protein